jgi:transcriptional regulator with XRE-family HTH domain
MNTIQRPSPVGVTSKHGYRIYDGNEMAAYRRSRSIDQTAVADRLHVSQSLISTYERVARGWELTEDVAVPMLDAIDQLAAKREKMAADGIADLASIRAARKAK